jgi:DNA-binding MarR family transcriptional regulator
MNFTTEEPKRGGTGSREKTERAFRAYLELLDAADYMKAEVYDQLSFYGVTMRGFRVLELLYRRGTMRLTAVAEGLRWSRQNLNVVVKGLTDEGWVRSELQPLGEGEPTDPTAPANGDSAGLEESQAVAEGRLVLVLSLTDEGRRFAERFLPRHAKVVKAYMRALEGREQQTLAELCRKLREGNVMKFISEMEHEDVEG